MAVEMFATHQGRVMCEAKHGPSGHTLETEAPADNGGTGQHFSPTDLLATALATCVLTTMALVAERRGIDLTGMTSRYEKHMTAQPTRRVGKLLVELHLPARLTDEERTVMERTAHTCPVHRSLHPDVQVEMTFAYDL